MQIAIDGPAGAGKSTIAKRLAEKMGFVYIDTGAMYRCITWKAINNKIDLADVGQLTHLASNTIIEFRQGTSQQLVFCDGHDVSSAIRSHEVNAAVSKVASHPDIRRIMVQQQKDMASSNSVVMDGRDIGECVLPNAEYKFYLTASIEERARRRQAELAAIGAGYAVEKVKMEIEERDKSDSNREVGSLKILSDSIVIDSSSMSIGELMDLILDTIRGSGHAV